MHRGTQGYTEVKEAHMVTQRYTGLHIGTRGTLGYKEVHRDT